MDFIAVLLNRYLSEIATAKANLYILMNNPTSVPEHSDWMKEMDKWISAIADSKEKVAVLKEELEKITDG